MSFPQQLLLFPLLFVPRDQPPAAPMGLAPLLLPAGVSTAQLLSSQAGLGIHPEADTKLGSRVTPSTAKAEGMSLDQSAQAKAEGVTQWQTLDQSAQANC